MDRWLTFAEQNLKPATIKRYREAIESQCLESCGFGFSTASRASIVR
jgi:hypothetical protein